MTRSVGSCLEGGYKELKYERWHDERDGMNTNRVERMETLVREQVSRQKEEERSGI